MYVRPMSIRDIGIRGTAGAAALLLWAGCGPAEQERSGVPAAESAVGAAPEPVLRAMARIDARAAGVDEIFLPLPLLRPAEEEDLRRLGNAPQLEAARRLGIPPDSPASALEAFIAEGRLVRLPDTTDHWIVRRLDYSQPLLTPDAVALLTELAERFHAALDALGAPRFRLEVTSVLRSAEDQARLRRVNPNAALGESTHLYGTTFDVAYSAFAPPAEPIDDGGMGGGEWRPVVERYAALAAETVAARRSRELMAVLGQVLREMQREGKVMVTLERLQPVYHMTVARRLADG
jgi:hypothetical protein